MSWQAFVAWIDALPTGWRLVAIGCVALGAHTIVKGLQVVGEWVLSPEASPGAAHRTFSSRRPKLATLVGLVVSGLTFAIYFLALGFVVGELTPLTLGQYLASATVLGLAVGFGTQGLVQDVVTGLTLIFSDTLEIGSLVEISGQTGWVERIGLRFTRLTNFHGQTVHIPNRNIATIGRFRTGYARAFLEVQIPTGAAEEAVVNAMVELASAFRAQHAGVIVGEPRLYGVHDAGEASGWRYLRIRFRIWPGQGALVENALRQRAIARLRELDPDAQDWMVTVTYRVQTPPGERSRSR